MSSDGTLLPVSLPEMFSLGVESRAIYISLYFYTWVRWLRYILIHGCAISSGFMMENNCNCAVEIMKQAHCDMRKYLNDHDSSVQS